MNQKRPTFPTTSWQFHVAFWLLYWGFHILQDAIFHPYFKENFNLPIVIGSVGLVYFNYYYWLPRHLIQRKKYWFYTLSMVTMIIVNAFLVNSIMWLFTNDAYYLSPRSALFMSIDTSVIVAFTTAFKFMQQWNERNQYAKELEKKNLESELEMLKSQINPHFIFNTLNMIYFLMEQKDEKAKEVLLKFSDILSHQLYDYNKEFIDLDKEIRYLENYIELQKLRYDEEILDLAYQLPKQTGGLKIAPMLLIPFIENAFKHGSNSSRFKVDVKLKLDNGQLVFLTKNSINLNKIKTKGIGGIGLKNVKRRLELTYANRYELDIQNDGKVYTANLKIQLK